LIAIAGLALQLCKLRAYMRPHYSGQTKEIMECFESLLPFLPRREPGKDRRDLVEVTGEETVSSVEISGCQGSLELFFAGASRY
jgi:hypothetical protein